VRGRSKGKGLSEERFKMLSKWPSGHCTSGKRRAKSYKNITSIKLMNSD